MKRIFKRCFFITALLVYMVGCGETPHTSPSVLSTNPVNTATNVAVNTTITASFNLAMVASTINTTTFTLMQGATPITGAVNYSLGVATFTPASILAHNTTYTATIMASVQNLNGNALGTNYTWSFTTGAGEGAKFSIFTSTGGTFSHSAAFDKSRNKYLVGIRGDAAGPNNIVARRMDGFGNISSSISLNSTGGTPVVAFDGTKSLVVWSDANNGIKGAKIDAGNAPSSVAPVNTTTGLMDIGPQSVLCNNLECVVVWRDKNTGTGYTRAIASSPPTCQTNEMPITSASNSDKDINISIAASESTYFIVWDTGKEIRRTIVTKCGMQTYKSELTIAAKNECSNLKPSVGVAFDGTNYLVVWNDAIDCAATPASTIKGQLVDVDGAAIGAPFNIIPANDLAATTPNSWRATSPSIAFDGTNYLVAWTDGRNDTNKDGKCDATEGTCDDVYGLYVSKSGAAVGSEFIINNDAGNQTGFITGFNAGSYFILVDSGVDPVSHLGSAIYGVLVTP